MGSLWFRFSALVFGRGFSVATASVLILLFLIPPDAPAKTPLEAATVHAKIAKRGPGNGVAVEENTGVILAGRILTIGSDSFTLQLFNDPQPVTIRYAEVAEIETGPARGFWIATGVGLAAVAGLSIWGFVHVHNLQQQNQLAYQPQPSLR